MGVLSIAVYVRLLLPKINDLQAYPAAFCIVASTCVYRRGYLGGYQLATIRVMRDFSLAAAYFTVGAVQPTMRRLRVVIACLSVGAFNPHAWTMPPNGGGNYWASSGDPERRCSNAIGLDPAKYSG